MSTICLPTKKYLYLTAQNVIARHNLLEGAIGTFEEEKQAYWIVTLLMWLLPTIVVAGAAIDAMLVIAYLKYAHPWKGILDEEKTGPETSKLQKLIQLLRFIYGIGGKVGFFVPLMGILCTIAHYHAATFSLTQDTLTNFNAESKCLKNRTEKLPLNCQ